MCVCVVHRGAGRCPEVRGPPTLAPPCGPARRPARRPACTTAAQPARLQPRSLHAPRALPPPPCGSVATSRQECFELPFPWRRIGIMSFFACHGAHTHAGRVPMLPTPQLAECAHPVPAAGDQANGTSRYGPADGVSLSAAGGCHGSPDTVKSALGCRAARGRRRYRLLHGRRTRCAEKNWAVAKALSRWDDGPGQ